MFTLYFNLFLLNPPSIQSFLALTFPGNFSEQVNDAVSIAGTIHRLQAAGENHGLTTKRDQIDSEAAEKEFSVCTVKPAKITLGCVSSLHFHDRNVCMFAGTLAQQNTHFNLPATFPSPTHCWTKTENVNRFVWDVSFPHY